MMTAQDIINNMPAETQWRRCRQLIECLRDIGNGYIQSGRIKKRKFLRSLAGIINNMNGCLNDLANRNEITSQFIIRLVYSAVNDKGRPPQQVLDAGLRPITSLFLENNPPVNFAAPRTREQIEKGERLLTKAMEMENNHWLNWTSSGPDDNGVIATKENDPMQRTNNFAQQILDHRIGLPVREWWCCCWEAVYIAAVGAELMTWDRIRHIHDNARNGFCEEENKGCARQKAYQTTVLNGLGWENKERLELGVTPYPGDIIFDCSDGDDGIIHHVSIAAGEEHTVVGIRKYNANNDHNTMRVDTIYNLFLVSPYLAEGRTLYYAPCPFNQLKMNDIL